MKSTLPFQTTILTLAILSTTLLGCRKQDPAMVGMVESREIVVASKLAGRLAEVLVEEGDTVTQGQVLARFTSPEVDAKVEQARGAVRGADARLRMAHKGARNEEIRMAESAAKQATEARELAETTWRRVEKLLADSTLSMQQADEVRTRWVAAQQTEQAALARLQMVKNGARPEEIDAAEGLADQAHNALREAEAWQKETTVIAPVSGIVQKRYLVAGEVAGAGSPILILVRPEDAWVALPAREDQVRNLRIGKQVSCDIPALGLESVSFQVTWLTAMGDFATWRSTSRMGDSDLRSFEVRLKPTQAVPGLLPGMTVRLHTSAS